ILELEAGGLQRLNIIHYAAVQIHGGSGIHEYLEPFEGINLVHYPRSVLKRHEVRECGATAADYTDAQPGWQRILLSHDLLDLETSCLRQIHRRFRAGFDVRSCCGSHALSP